MPLHPVRLRERGYNQSEWIGRGLSACTGTPLHTHQVVRLKATRSQTKLTPEERRRNVQGAFRVQDAPSLAGAHVALVDDVFTTGATLDSCASALMESGAAAVYALTAARA
jgi:ComF family protein